MASDFADIPFSSIAVIGAGTMGSAIAGQIANAGLDVLLLDMPDDDAEHVNRRSIDAVDRLKKSDPPALFPNHALKGLKPAISAMIWQSLLMRTGLLRRWSNGLISRNPYIGNWLR